MFKVTPELLEKLHVAAPRYTSYPTAPEWMSIEADLYAKKLEEEGKSEAPLSLYFHIPFCKSMCLFCGCSVILNRKAENEERYVEYLKKEIRLVAQKLGKRKKVSQLHFGGGTPTKLSIPLFRSLFTAIVEAFDVDFSKEVAIEVDPRTVVEDDGAKLRFLADLGFNRVSFGVQDVSEKVQVAIARNQSYEMTRSTYFLAKQLGFNGINIDLIYGLPYQTLETFYDTITKITQLKPDRIALFSYAKVPWLKAHQKAMKDETLPSTADKFKIYADARKRLLQAGYMAIGMDHFALPHDEIAKAYYSKTLQRNFQGYTVRLAENMLGLGVTSIGFLGNTYFQSLKELPEYYQSLDQNQLPVHRGLELSAEDILRKWVIHTLMCNFELDKAEFETHFKLSFNEHFAGQKEALEALESDGLLRNTHQKILVTALGELFIRNIARVFDAYQKESLTPLFSQSI